MGANRHTPQVGKKQTPPSILDDPSYLKMKRSYLESKAVSGRLNHLQLKDFMVFHIQSDGTRARPYLKFDAVESDLSRPLHIGWNWPSEIRTSHHLDDIKNKPSRSNTHQIEGKKERLNQTKFKGKPGDGAERKIVRRRLSNFRYGRALVLTSERCNTHHRFYRQEVGWHEIGIWFVHE